MEKCGAKVYGTLPPPGARVRLSSEDFSRVRQQTVLAALDLLIINKQGHVIVGRRCNAPAKGYLFVPGGRIHKSETLADALGRISSSEVGVRLEKSQGALHGVYDHIYREDSPVPEESIQYVVIACRFIVDGVVFRPDAQHQELEFMAVEDLIKSPEVHSYTKNYFLEAPPNLFLLAASIGK